MPFHRIEFEGDDGTLPMTDTFEEQNVRALGWDYSCAQPVPNTLNPMEQPYPACPLLARALPKRVSGVKEGCPLRSQGTVVRTTFQPARSGLPSLPPCGGAF